MVHSLESAIKPFSLSPGQNLGNDLALNKSQRQWPKLSRVSRSRQVVTYYPTMALGNLSTAKSTLAPRNRKTRGQQIIVPVSSGPPHSPQVYLATRNRLACRLPS